MPRVAKALDHAPNALAVIRPAIGVASGSAVSTDNAAIAAWLYLAGYLSDVRPASSPWSIRSWWRQL